MEKRDSTYYLLSGWTMLSEGCPNCLHPLYQDRRNTDQVVCAHCNLNAPSLEAFDIAAKVNQKSTQSIKSKPEPDIVSSDDDPEIFSSLQENSILFRHLKSLQSPQETKPPEQPKEPIIKAIPSTATKHIKKTSKQSVSLPELIPGEVLQDVQQIVLQNLWQVAQQLQTSEQIEEKKQFTGLIQSSVDCLRTIIAAQKEIS